MGSTHSKNLVYTSKPSDTLRNLEWAIQSRFEWEQRAEQAKHFLLGQSSSAATGENNMGNEASWSLSGNALDFAQQELLSARKTQVEANDAIFSCVDKKRRRRYFDELDASRSGMQTQAALGQSASEIFGAGASAQLASPRNHKNNHKTNTHNNTNTNNRESGSGMVSSKQISGTNLNMKESGGGASNVGKPLGSQSGEETRVSRNRVSSEGDWTHPGVGGSERWMGQATQDGSRPDLFSTDHLSRLQKNCMAKFLFIHSLLDKCLRNAEYCYKLSHCSNLTKRHLKARRNSDPTELSNLSGQQRMSMGYLTEALANFDRARETHRWAVRDYDLSLALLKVDRTLQRLNTIRRQVDAAETVSVAPLSLQLDSVMRDLNTTKQHLLTATHRNDRGALNLGFNYLDENRNGTLEARHLQGLSPHLMRLLQVDGTHPLTRAHLQAAIDQQTMRVSENMNRIKGLEVENARLAAQGHAQSGDQMQSNWNEIHKLTVESQHSSNALADLYQFFLSAFARSIFSDLDAGHIQTQEIDRNNLTDALHRMMLETGTDPLQPQNGNPFTGQHTQKQADRGGQTLLHTQTQANPIPNQTVQQDVSKHPHNLHSSNQPLLPTNQHHTANVREKFVVERQPLSQERSVLSGQQQPQQLQANLPIPVAMPAQQIQPADQLHQMHAVQQDTQQQSHVRSGVGDLGVFPTQTQQEQIASVASGAIQRSNSGFQAHPHTQQKQQQQDIRGQGLAHQSMPSSVHPSGVGLGSEQGVASHGPPSSVYTKEHLSHPLSGPSSVRPVVDSQSMLPVNKHAQLPVDSTMDKERHLYS